MIFNKNGRIIPTNATFVGKPLIITTSYCYLGAFRYGAHSLETLDFL